MGRAIDGVHHITNVALNASTATRLCTARCGRGGLIFQNQAAEDIYIGGSTVTASGATRGFLLKGGQAPPTAFSDTASAGEWWGISASGTPSLFVDEIWGTA